MEDGGFSTKELCPEVLESNLSKHEQKPIEELRLLQIHIYNPEEKVSNGKVRSNIVLTFLAIDDKEMWPFLVAQMCDIQTITS